MHVTPSLPGPGVARKQPRRGTSSPEYTCARCHQTFPRTADYFYFSKGLVVGYCKANHCHAAYLAEYWRRGRTPYQQARHAVVSRESYRRRKGVTPDRYKPTRVGVPIARRVAS